MRISVLMLTHNAPQYVEETITTFYNVTNPDMLQQCELVVVDNQSDQETKEVLKKLHSCGFIDTLYFSEVNTFFSGGNNLAASFASNDSDMYLLLNSDVKICHPDWLSILIREKLKYNASAISFGTCRFPTRCDGYCLLIDKHVYDKFKLDENLPWWGGVTNLQGRMLKEGHNLATIAFYERYIHHYGGSSGTDYKQAGRFKYSDNEEKEWFANGKGKIYEVFVSKFDYWQYIKWQYNCKLYTLRKILHI